MPADSKTLAALRAKLADAKASGRGVVHIERFARRVYQPGWSLPQQCRVVSGRPPLMGRCLGRCDDGQWAFDVRLADLERWLDGSEGSRDA